MARTSVINVVSRRESCKTVVTTTIRLQFDCHSTDVRLPFDCNLTALRPFDDLRYDLRPISCGLLHRGLCKLIGQRDGD